MFKLNERVLQLDAPFQHEGTSYPANWLRLSSPEEREALGIVEEPDDTPIDQRFYTASGEAKNLDEVKALFLASLKRTVKGLLETTDWAILRKLDTGAEVPEDIQAKRESIRQLNTQAETSILGANDVESLKTVIDGLFWHLPT